MLEERNITKEWVDITENNPDMVKIIKMVPGIISNRFLNVDIAGYVLLLM